MPDKKTEKENLLADLEKFKKKLSKHYPIRNYCHVTVFTKFWNLYEIIGENY